MFGYAGDGINGLLAAWGRADNDPRFIQARHEEMAAFEAVGYAKFTGQVGVCAATSGPGASVTPARTHPTPQIDAEALRAGRAPRSHDPQRRHERGDQS